MAALQGATRTRPTSWYSTSASPMSTGGSGCACSAVSAKSRSWWPRPATTSTRSSPRSTPVPTTTWSSRSRPRSSTPASGRCCVAGAGDEADQPPRRRAHIDSRGRAAASTASPRPVPTGVRPAPAPRPQGRRGRQQARAADRGLAAAARRRRQDRRRPPVLAAPQARRDRRRTPVPAHRAWRRHQAGAAGRVSHAPPTHAGRGRHDRHGRGLRGTLGADGEDAGCRARAQLRPAGRRRPGPRVASGDAEAIGSGSRSCAPTLGPGTVVLPRRHDGDPAAADEVERAWTARRSAPRWRAPAPSSRRSSARRLGRGMSRADGRAAAGVSRAWGSSVHSACADRRCGRRR